MASTLLDAALVARSEEAVDDYEHPPNLDRVFDHRPRSGHHDPAVERRRAAGLRLRARRGRHQGQVLDPPHTGRRGGTPHSEYVDAAPRQGKWAPARTDRHRPGAGIDPQPRGWKCLGVGAMEVGTCPP